MMHPLLLLLLPFLCLSTELTDEEFEDTETDREAVIGERLGRPGGSCDMKCRDWTNRHFDVAPGQTCKFTVDKHSKRCTVSYKRVDGCKELTMTCTKCFLDNRDPDKCLRGDVLFTKPAKGPIHRYCKRNCPSENFPVVSPDGNLKIWVKHVFGVLGYGRYPARGAICYITCSNSYISG